MFSVEVPLRNIYDKLGSFHEKATIVACSNGNHILTSYGKRICMVTPEDAVYIGKDFIPTKTSLRHVKEFLKQHNLECYKMADIQKLPTVEM